MTIIESQQAVINDLNAENEALDGGTVRTITLEIELTYDADMMHGDDPDGVEWFRNCVLQNDGNGEENNLLLHSNAIGDTLGEVRVTSIKGEVEL